MKPPSIEQIVNDMKQRINSLEMTVIKMEQSGKFDPDDPRFERMQDQIYEMTQMMTRLSILNGDRPYKLEHPSLDNPKCNNKEDKNDESD